ncbi:MAG: hypothetical protein AAF797_12665 [Planctomycetota bacterium]
MLAASLFGFVDDGLGEGVSRPVALRRAWGAWVVMAASPVVWALFLLGVGLAEGSSGMGLGLTLLAMGWMVAGVPVSYVVRLHCFRATWLDRPVEPASYLRGVCTVWGVASLGAWLGLTAVAVGGSWWPGVMPVVLAVGVMLALRPEKAAMAARASWSVGQVRAAGGSGGRAGGLAMGETSDVASGFSTIGDGSDTLPGPAEGV